MKVALMMEKNMGSASINGLMALIFKDGILKIRNKDMENLQ